MQREVGGETTGPGYGKTNNITFHAAHHHLNTTKKPTLKCGQKNDRFTVSDVIIGNEASTYPIGLITAYETSMSGLLYQTLNTNNYLYSGNNYWTFSLAISQVQDQVIVVELLCFL